jgi:hypothetical protein
MIPIRFSRLLHLVVYITAPGVSLQAQNIIQNGGFEIGTLPTAWAQTALLENWESRSALYNPFQNGSWGHSPDYFDDNMIFNTAIEPDGGMRNGVPPLNIDANTGTRFIGMDNYELIQQKYFNNSLQERRYYTISMWIRPSSLYFDGTTNLKVILSNNRVNYANSQNYSEYDNCTQDYRTLTNIGNSLVVGSWSINLATYSSSEWTRIATTFYVDENVNESYSWLNLSTENNSSCDGQYIFIDDVSFRLAGDCASDCAPELGQTSIGTLPTLMIADGYCAGSPNCAECPDRYTGACQPPCNEFEGNAVNCHCCPVQFFQLIVQNAIGVNFWVYARDSHATIHYEQHSFDANGLKFGEQDYFVLQWMGRTMSGDHLPAGIYDYELEVWNCAPSSQQIFEGFFYYEVGSQYFAQPPNVVNSLLASEYCCPFNKYFQNITFDGMVVEGAESYITAGFSVTTGVPGLVLVPQTANVEFRAGDEINIEPGFVVQPGGVFEAIITDCVYGTKSVVQTPPQYAFVHMAPYDRAVELNVSIYPNPTDGIFTVALPAEIGEAEVIVRDALGRIMFTHVCRSSTEIMEFSHFSKGMYILEVLVNGERYQTVRVSYE